MSLFVCGDTHGRTYDTQKLSTKRWSEQKTLTKNDVLVQLGDFGWVWYPFGKNKEQEYWLDNLAGKKYTLAVVLGNHENYDIIETLPIIRKWGNPVRVLKRKTGEIYFLERGYVYTIHGKKVFAFGGAQSNERPDNTEPVYIPKMYGMGKRKKYEIIEGKDWWSQELPTEEEKLRGIENLIEHQWKVDYVLTHTAPSTIIPHLKDAIIESGEKWYDKNDSRTEDPLSIYFEEIYQNLSFKQWAFGHFHVDMSIEQENKIFHAFYNTKPLNLLDF